MRNLVRRLLSPAMYGRLSALKERRQLARLPRCPADAAPLQRPWGAEKLAHLLADGQLEPEWQALAARVAELGISDAAGGVNPGDRRALYYLARGLRARRVLEIGTHIGSSTVHLAAAVVANSTSSSTAGQPGGARLASVDCEDCNHPQQGPWRRAGMNYPPGDMLARLGVGEHVAFYQAWALDYLRQGSDTFDLIFLDGDHAATAVYQELSASLSRLAPGGVVVLHDYFPEARPLWPQSIPKPGPWLAAKRLRREGVALEVLPLGRLPWPTKLGSHVTSLALVVGR